MDIKGMGRRRTQLLGDLRKIRNYLVLKEEAEDRKKVRNVTLSIEHKEKVHVIFHKSINVLIT